VREYWVVECQGIVAWLFWERAEPPADGEVLSRRWFWHGWFD
jgi:hypothetical protein